MRACVRGMGRFANVQTQRPIPCHQGVCVPMCPPWCNLRVGHCCGGPVGQSREQQLLGLLLRA